MQTNEQSLDSFEKTYDGCDVKNVVTLNIPRICDEHLPTGVRLYHGMIEDERYNPYTFDEEDGQGKQVFASANDGFLFVNVHAHNGIMMHQPMDLMLITRDEDYIRIAEINMYYGGIGSDDLQHVLYQIEADMMFYSYMRSRPVRNTPTPYTGDDQ